MNRTSKNRFSSMGPAWIISAVACGPATLAAVSKAGAGYSYTLLWVVVLSAVFGTTAQYLAAKAGVLSGKGIIRTTEEKLGKTCAWILTIDALAATWLAAMVLMNALAGITSVLTNIHTPLWGILFGILICLFLLIGGYSWFELFCKLLVAFVVCCFISILFIGDIDTAQMMHGLIPSLPDGIDSALLSAAIMGGAVHITIIGMHTYTVNARNWKPDDLKLARTDTILSMGVAFGLYSIAIFTVSAAVLHPNQIAVKKATDAALALAPLLGEKAMFVFLTGLFAAALSTISPTFLAGAYFVADKMGWQKNRRDSRFRWIIIAGCLLSMAGPFVKGGFFFLLPLMLALGLVGTPLILLVLLYLLNTKPLKDIAPNSLVLNTLGGLTLLITTFLAGRFILEIFLK